jgi:site-specific recombinase XerD
VRHCRSFTNKQLKKILVDNDLPALSVHALRHSNASLMINNGFDVKAISEHLGHCNTAITSDIYTHIFMEYKAKMAESIEKDLI